MPSDTAPTLEHTPPEVPSPYGDRRLKAWEHFVLAAYWFASNFHWGALLVVLLPEHVAKFDPENRAQSLGFLTGISAVVALAVPLFFAALTDRCTSRWGRRRPYMAMGIGINVIGLLLMAATFTARVPVTGVGFPSSFFARPEFLWYVIGFLIVQFGNNVTSTAYMGVIPDLVPANQRGIASGWMSLLSLLGNLAGAFVAGMKEVSMTDWMPYVACCAGLMGVGAITIFGMKETPLPLPKVKVHWPTYLKSLWISPKEHPDFAWVWITRALVMLGFYAFLPFINYYLVDVIGIPHGKVGEEAPKLLAIILFFACLSSIYGGQLSDKIGRKKVVFVANGGIAVVALGFIVCRDMTQAMIVGSIFGLFYGAYGSVDYALGTDVLPNKAHAGKDMAVWHIAMTLPQTFASPIAGALIASFGSTKVMENGEQLVRYTPNGYAAVFVLCSVSFGVGAILLRNVRGVK